MKVVSALKLICEDCYIVRRGKRLYMRCRKHPRHKRRQGFSTLNYRGAQPLTEGAEMVRSYDGFSMGDPDMIASFNYGTSSVMSEIMHCSGGGCCSICQKPIMPYNNMATSMQAKMDYLELVNQQAEAEDQADEDDCDK